VWHPSPCSWNRRRLRRSRLRGVPLSLEPWNADLLDSILAGDVNEAALRTRGAIRPRAAVRDVASPCCKELRRTPARVGVDDGGHPEGESTWPAPLDLLFSVGARAPDRWRWGRRPLPRLGLRRFLLILRGSRLMREVRCGSETACRCAEVSSPRESVIELLANRYRAHAGCALSR